MQKVKSCGVLVFRSSPVKSFLLMKHPHRWDLPKGHVDEGESERECALRELNEETGIPQDALELDDDFRFTLKYLTRYKRFGGETVEKTLVVFLAHLLRDVPIKTTEHADFQWREWRPPHSIQAETIDPLLSAVQVHSETS